MGNAEIIVRPVFEDGTKSYLGIEADFLSLQSIASILFTAQNIAQHRDRTMVLDKGIALWPTEVLELRSLLSASMYKSGGVRNEYGILPVEPAVQLADYLLLLQATERNKRVFETALEDHWSHWRADAVPPAVTADPASVRGIRLLKRHNLAQERERQLEASAAWLKRDQTHQEKLVSAKLDAERGFETAGKIRQLLAV
ncbi:MAG TPA: hypothetical protein VGP12_05950 [Nitrosospira sp.]|jgi:hypothetical protein|nr:hypothetical protein [Nitrosospira sp.]